MNNKELVPAILPMNFGELEEKVSKISSSFDIYHLDISDGKFSPNTTWPFSGGGEFLEIKKEKRGMPELGKIDFEIHLMTKNSVSIIPDWIRVGAVRIIVHIEDLDGDLLHDTIEEWGRVAEFSLALCLGTPFEKIEMFANDVHHIHLMTIEKIGYQGQKLSDIALQRVGEARKLFPKHLITVDGGVNEDNAGLLREAGADRLISGSAFWKKLAESRI